MPQCLEDELGPLIRELKQLNPRVFMRELRDPGGYDIRRLPILPQQSGHNGYIEALLRVYARIPTGHVVLI